MSDYSKYQFLKIEKQGKVAIVTMNRPESLNAMNRVGLREMDTIWGDLENDEEVLAVVLTGAGRGFSSGGDFRDDVYTQDPSTRPPWIAHMHVRHGIHQIIDARYPVIAAVNGPAAGLAASYALVCDIIFIGESGRILDSHVSNLGWVAGDGGVITWPLLIGLNRAKEYLFTGDPIRGKDAERLGLANRCFPDDQLLPEAIAFAQRLAGGPPLAIRGTKHALNQHIRLANLIAMDLGFALEGLTSTTEDGKEAPQAFMQKRKPQFKGR
ncbi:MAG: enoyl-CoA hydratase/isomerase family protein [Chloroflexi bacterium]|nr:enoyl-CoA hydratase/isomerase family protein [Chloroflexota bacterium]